MFAFVKRNFRFEIFYKQGDLQSYLTMDNF